MAYAQSLAETARNILPQLTTWKKIIIQSKKN